MEKLTVLLLLFLSGFGSAEPYFAELDRLFLESPDDSFLFELEDCLKDLRGHWARVSERFAANIGDDIKKFGRELSGGVQEFFDENVSTGKITLREFGRMGYKLWLLLSDLNIEVDSDPYVVLCYADEPLDYGDEKQSLELYRYFFDFYKESS
ncbi:MAG: hypothetical protein K2O14_02600 [Oscillospiraceae bacterium]|nr:hypothetical protein [Oscillospiraceae bacterium]